MMWIIANVEFDRRLDDATCLPSPSDAYCILIAATVAIFVVLFDRTPLFSIVASSTFCSSALVREYTVQ